MNRDKELYRQLRALPWEKLWSQEVPRFNAATAKERLERVAVIRAVAVVFTERESRDQLSELKVWIRALLKDPQEKVRRYAAAALPKLGADLDDERELLSIAKAPATDREKKHVSAALAKIGGKETLKHAEGLPPRAIQRIQAKVARDENPSAISLDAVIKDQGNLAIHLRCRSGLENFVTEEARELKKFQVIETLRGLVILSAHQPFALRDLFAMRCFADVSFSLNVTGDPAAIATSPAALKLLHTLTDGSIRYRIDFVDKGHQRSAVAKLAQEIHAKRPELINGGGDTPWSIEIRGTRVELAPKVSPDPRFAYRRRDVPAASHPPLAACLARLAGPLEHDIVWDPFCGSGVELIERSILGGVAKVIGTDLSGEAIDITRQNFEAAKIPNVTTRFVASDFRRFDPGQVSLIITNPPMGKRVPIPNLRKLIADLFESAARFLKPGGRLVFANPAGFAPPAQLFTRDFSQLVDFGGFHCRVEKYTFTQSKKGSPRRR